MYYKLKKPYALRGWEKLPYALINRDKGETLFINKAEYDTLSMCNGKIDFDNILILQEYRDMAEKILENGFIEWCKEGDAIEDWQEYRLHPSRYIKTAHWSVTGKCNYRCKHCYMSAPDAKLGELSHGQCMDMIDQLHECGIMHVTLTGGEPLVRKDFLQIVDRLLSYHIKIDTIYSNGKLITPGLLDALAGRGIHPEFNLSFDGVGWHDWMRGVPGAEQAAIDAFRLCSERGFPLGVETTLHKKNIHTLRDTMNFLAEMDVGHVKVNPAAPVGAWLKNAGDDSLSMHELYDAYLDYIPQFFADGSPLTVMLGGFFYARKGAKTYAVPAMKFGGSPAAESYCICGHARQVMYISADGVALPCMSLSGMEISKNYPSILEHGLAKCISDSSYMELIDTRLKQYLEYNEEQCGRCEYKYTCGGGCRASALNDTPDDIMAPDHYTCAIFKQGYPGKITEKIEEELGSRFFEEKEQTKAI